MIQDGLLRAANLVASRVTRRGDVSQEQHERSIAPLCDVFRRVNVAPKETSLQLSADRLCWILFENTTSSSMFDVC